MKRQLTLIPALIMAGLIASGGCNKPNSTGTSGGPPPGGVSRLNGSGATFIDPMMQKWAGEYYKTKKVQVNYTPKGSGAGKNEMIAGTTDFGSSDAPMTDKEIDEAKKKGGDVIHVPLAMGAVVPAYKLDGIKEQLIFSGPTLAGIYMGKITKWNDDAIKKDNPGVDLPDKKIAVARRSDASGTTYIFTDYLSKVSPEFEKSVGRNTSPTWPEGIPGFPQNAGVAGFVAQTDGAIGYVELIYALQNKINFGKVINKEGVPVVGSLESVTKAAEAALKEIPDDLRYSLTDASGKDAYPIAGTNWAVLYVQQPAGKKETLADFLTWVTHDGQKLCEELHYSKLPPGLVERVEKKIASIQTKK
jgi:phosphate transport system substrate-binding protein